MNMYSSYLQFLFDVLKVIYKLAALFPIIQWAYNMWDGINPIQTCHKIEVVHDLQT